MAERSTGKVKAVVLADTLGYIDDDGVTQRVAKGTTVELSKADFERHLAHGMVAKPGKAAEEALAEAEAAESGEPEAPPAE